MKFDETIKEFYVEKEDVYNISTIDESDLTKTFGSNVDLDMALKEKSQDVYMYLDDQQNVGDPYHHALAVRYMIYKNVDKQTAIKRAVIEHIRGAVETGMDLEAYENEGKEWLSPKVKMILKRSGLIVTGQVRIPYFTLEGDWGAQAE